MFCDVYRWKGHHFDTPLYNSKLNNVEVIKKCRCGKTKTSIQYIPLPETIESERLLTGYSPSEVSELFNDEFYRLLVKAQNPSITPLLPLLFLFGLIGHFFKWIFNMET